MARDLSEASVQADPEVLRRLADEIVPSLTARLLASDLGELEVRAGGWRVRLRRAMTKSADAEGEPPAADGGRRAGRGQGRSHIGVPVGTDPAAAGGNGAGRAPLAIAVERAGPASGGASTGREPTRRPSVTSPAVGYFAPRDGVGPGHRVRTGDLLGHVDVLGVPQDVVASADGIVGRVLVQPGEAVEYGQELVRLEPAGARGKAPA